MEKMTEERLENLRKRIALAKSYDETLAVNTDTLTELVDGYCTLQQQNAQMIEAFEKLDSIHDFATPLEDDVTYSFVDVSEANEIHSEVKELFDRIKGGSVNESGT